MIKIDLRSDTVTMPSREMLDHMMSARAGDMVLDEDPSVNMLEERIAAIFGFEAAAYCPSGTMTNQIAIKVHTRPGDEVICSSKAHVYLYEGGGIASNSGVQVSMVDSSDGVFTAEDVLARINPDDPHKARTSLVTIENTANRGGGTVWSRQTIEDIGRICRLKGLKYHLDGARIFNALAVSGDPASYVGTVFDSCSVCLSKGLGAPVGSVLSGSREFIKQAKRARKSMGGTMRQAGYLAAAGLFALEHNIPRLVEDHANALKIRTVLSSCDWVDKCLPGETNIVIASMSGEIRSETVIKKLAEQGILASIVDASTIRFVTHLDVSDEMTQQACSIIKSLKISSDQDENNR
ncbi:MAG: GntG family PLP-dependent aldolase [Bacteroidales bacterium]